MINDFLADIGSGRVSVCQKIALGEEIVSRRSSAAELTKITGIKRALLNKYAWQVRHLKIVQGSRGRPRALDEESIVRINDLMETDGPFDDTSLRGLIKEEYQQTRERRYGEDANRIEAPLRTVNRYDLMFISIS